MTKEEFVQLVYLNLAGEISDKQFSLLNEQTMVSTEWSDLRAETEAIWDDTSKDISVDLAASKPAYKKLEGKIANTNSRSSKVVWLRYTSSIAAVALLILAMTFLFGEEYDTFSAGNTVEHFVLEDGSEVYLGPQGELQVSRQEKRRVVLKGDAYFEITKDKSQAFTVITQAADITVLGTKFSVLADNKYTRLDVNQGKVKIENKDKSKSEIVTERQSVEAVLASQKLNKLAYLDNHQGPFLGKYQFENRLLKEVLSDLSILLDTEINASSKINSCRINGILYAKTGRALLQQIADYYGATLTDRQGIVYIENGECK